MKLQEIKDIAVARGVKPGKAKKVDLVRQIQAAEGNVACYATDADGSCDQTACLWRGDCTAEARKLA